MEDNFWKNKKVLITGGTGFLGKHLADALLKKDAILRILDFRKPVEEIKGIEFFEADIRDKNKINELCRGSDLIFHLAAMPSIAKGKFKQYYEVNVLGTNNILEGAHNYGIKKVVHVSSSTVYGMPREFPLKETSPTQPLGKYSSTKLEAERLCNEFMNKGISISIIRPRVIIGPGRIGIFSILFERIINNKPVYILGKGDNVFQFTNVFDMASACIKAAEYEKSDLFNIGCEEVSPVKEELKGLISYAKSSSQIISLPANLTKAGLWALSFLGMSPLVEEQFMIADKNFKLDTTYAKEKLDWFPIYSNLDSLIQAYDWYAKNENLASRQYKSLFSVLGKFRHSHLGGFQNQKRG
ncbi:MAG: NAD(P)-dependent oxidoreductase [Candidatus Omnitrophota bacterium]|nr:NAD(P)-dependent oxidoreductase [Candidatus Omnitrophota bacterium]